MSRSVDDKLIEKLYQARKAQCHAPEVAALNAIKNKSKASNRFARLAGLLGLSGVVSFSIFALISQLMPEQKTPYESTINYEPVELPLPISNEQQSPIQQPMQLPERKSPQQLPAQAQLNVDPLAEQPLSGHISVTELTELPFDTAQFTLNKPVLSNKVMPDYPFEAIQQNLEAVIRLSYLINQQGEVYDIRIESNGHARTLERKAINALAQWRYKMPTAEHKELLLQRQRVEFNFALNQH